MTLNFEVDSPKFHCTDEANLKDVGYKPGDGQIFLNTALFNLSAGGAPPNELILVGQDGETDPYTKDMGFETKNSLVVPSLPLGVLKQPVGGFVNSESPGEHDYSISYLIRDAAGVYAPPPESNTCILRPVYAAEIEGTLAKSSGCFIATAAFRLKRHQCYY